MVNYQVQLFLDNMVLANQNAKLTRPDQGFLVSPPRPHTKALGTRLRRDCSQSNNSKHQWLLVRI
jgi:hypothetical protein